jgi:hypothetical protein
MSDKITMKVSFDKLDSQEGWPKHDVSVEANFHELDVKEFIRLCVSFGEAVGFDRTQLLEEMEK